MDKFTVILLSAICTSMCVMHEYVRDLECDRDHVRVCEPEHVRDRDHDRDRDQFKTPSEPYS